MTHLRLSRLLGRDRRVLAVLVALGLGVAATYVVQALVLSQVFGVVLGPRGWHEDLLPWVGALAAVLVARPVLVFVRELASTALMGRVKSRLRDDLLGHLVEQGAADVRGRTGSDHALVVDGVENLDPYLSRYLPQLVVVAVMCSAVGAVMVVIDPVVGLASLAAVLVVPLLPRLWDRALARRGADHWDAYQSLHTEFVDSMSGMTTLVLHGAAGRRQRQLEHRSESLLRATMRQLQLSLVESGLNAFALVAVPAAVPGSTAPVLVGVTAAWTPDGPHVVVGPSGSGKSTLAAVLAGLLEQDDGVVMLDGDVLGREDRRRAVSLVAQEPVLLAGTVAENIALAQPFGPSAPDVAAAAALAGIGSDDPSITLATEVGERGALLSGGQRQRVAIARALRQDRPVLVLDESASALDRRSEDRILERLVADRPDRVLLTVMHRSRDELSAISTTALRGGQVVPVEVSA